MCILFVKLCNSGNNLNGDVVHSGCATENIVFGAYVLWECIMGSLVASCSRKNCSCYSMVVLVKLCTEVQP